MQTRFFAPHGTADAPSLIMDAPKRTAGVHFDAACVEPA
jgi:hypothetical protein